LSFESLGHGGALPCPFFFEPEGGKDMADPVIELSGVWKIFGTAEQAALADARAGASKAEILAKHNCVVGIADASISVMPGEIFVIMGLSGSGKSTLLRHVNRLIEPTSGDIRVLGQDVRALSPTALRALRAERIGMVFQHMALMPHRSVQDNVAYPLELRGAPKATRWKVSAEKLGLVGLNGYGNRLPKQLSGGMQQRVGLARALAADPSILLMDEPFSALDPLIRRQLQDQFIELSHKLGKTTLFITHDLDEAIRVGSRIAIMKDGRIVQTGTPEEIVTRPADDYVKAFVQNISKLGLITAQTVMEPLASLAPFDAANAPQAPVTANLDALIGLSTGSALPVVIHDGEQAVGVVTKDRLLLAIKEGR
jgi:glycine betaine/proline transport system ATP-binding protein